MVRGNKPISGFDVSDAETESTGTIRSLGRGMAVSLLLILFAVAMIIGLVFFSADSIDQYASKKSEEQVQRLVELELEKIAALSLEYGWWNEAVRKVIYERDMEWAEENVGGYLQRTYNLSWVLSLDVNGELVHGKKGGETLATVPDEVMTQGLKNLVAEAISTDFSDPKPASGIISINGSPGLAAVTSFTVYEPSDLEIDRSHGAVVLVRLLDSELLSSWMNDFQIDQLSFAPGNSNTQGANNESIASIPLTTVQAEFLGELQWAPETAGKRFLSLLLPWVLSGAGIIVLASVILYFKLQTYRRLARNHFVELITSRQILARQANYDFLTGLPNRSSFIESVNREVSRCHREKTKAAVMYMDLDGFKLVNDTLGHSFGDQLLCLLAEKLRKLVREEDTVARFGGDEFCFLLTNIRDESEVYPIIRKIHDAFAAPITIEGRKLTVGVSIGVVMVPDDTSDCSSVFRYSDIAMYQAKSRGENGYCFFTDDMEEASKHRGSVKSALATAIERDELHVVYQPIYRLSDNSIVGVEALLRWQSAELGDVPPLEFIPIAEESGAISAIGFWVFDRALQDINKINEEAGVNLVVSVNVSVRQLRDHDFPERLDTIRKKHNVDASNIWLEITESLLISEQQKEHSAVTDLSDRGYKLVLDDFGTGYSALGYLQRYPVESIKIDKSFISGPASSGSPLVKSIVYIATASGMMTVAEGIETPEQEEFVLAMGCSFGQGFYFCRPQVLEQIILLVGEKKSALLP